MSKNKKINSYIIGDDTLVIQCAEALISKKHRILGIISSLPAIQMWATKNHLPCLTHLSDLVESEIEPCD